MGMWAFIDYRRLEAAVALDRLERRRPRMLPLDLLERRPARPCESSSTADTDRLVGAEGQRHLRELRPVQRPVHLNGAMLSASSRASATCLTSS